MKDVCNYFREQIEDSNIRRQELIEVINNCNINRTIIIQKIDDINSRIDQSNSIFTNSDNITKLSDNTMLTLQKKLEEYDIIISESKKKIEEIDNNLCKYNNLLEQSKECADRIICEDTEYVSDLSINSVDRLDALKIQEFERQRIARDIHDTVVQEMTSVMHKSEFIMKIVDTDPMRAKLELELIHRIMKECISELRQIIYDLHPMSLDDLGLDVTLQKYISTIDSGTFQINFKYELDNIKLEPVVSLTIMRIVQELCNNSIKYSEGKVIDLHIYYKNDKIMIIQQDDGVGYDYKNYKNTINKEEKNGFGLSMLRERLFLLGGKISYRHRYRNNINKINKGSKYIIEIPYKIGE